jgi:DNA-binding NarL/FixJ family response regulator
VVVVDDHPVICEALAAMLRQEEDMVCCGTVQTAAAALDLVASSGPEVAIVDISLSDAHGLSLVNDLRARFPGVQIVIYSMNHEAAYAERAIRAGALGYVTKGESSRSVVDAIRTVRDGRIYLNRNIASRMLGKMVHRGGQDVRAGIDMLTDQELAVFQMMGQSHTVVEIADRLGVSRKTVVAYQRRVKSKLGLETVGKLVQHAFQWAQGTAKTVA